MVVITAGAVDKKEKGMPTISIVTATYNAAVHLPVLIESLRGQTDKQFEWVIADGGSSDETLAILNAISDLNIRLDSRADFGIYDALNRALQYATGDYYLVLGADDCLYSDAVANFRRVIAESDADIVSAKFDFLNERKSVRKKPLWFAGISSLISSHSVGAAFRRKLHEKYGLYSRKFPVAADFDFVLNVYAGGGKIVDTDFASGRFGTGGLSSVDIAGYLTETFRIQLKNGSSRIVQILLLLARLVIHSRRI